MKKYILAILLAAITFISIQAGLQDKCWSMYSFDGTIEGTDTYILDAGHDTTVNGKTYYHFPSYILYFRHGGFLREEGSKIYLLNRYSGEDMLLYDFSLEIGDSIRAICTYSDWYGKIDPTYAPYEWHYKNGVDIQPLYEDADFIDEYMYVTAIETIQLVNGEERAVQVFQHGWRTIRVIEGIGSMNGLWNMVSYYPSPITPLEYVLYCCSESGVKLYQKDQGNIDGMPGYEKVYCGCETENSMENTSKEIPGFIPYNVLGQEVDESYHGIVIQDGKKRLQ